MFLSFYKPNINSNFYAWIIQVYNITGLDMLALSYLILWKHSLWWSLCGRQNKTMHILTLRIYDYVTLNGKGTLQVGLS